MREDWFICQAARPGFPEKNGRRQADLEEKCRATCPIAGRSGGNLNLFASAIIPLAHFNRVCLSPRPATCSLSRHLAIRDTMYRWWYAARHLFFLQVTPATRRVFCWRE